MWLLYGYIVIAGPNDWYTEYMDEIMLLREIGEQPIKSYIVLLQTNY